MKPWEQALIALLLLLIPAPLSPAESHCYVPDYPVVVMDTGSYQYIMDGPGQRIRMEEKCINLVDIGIE